MVAAKKMTLTGAALRYLRGLGHSLDPVVAIGKAGITEGLVEQTKRALLKHELVKVRVQSEAPVDRKEGAEELATAADAVLAQVLGRTFLLYRRRAEKPKIVLPKVGKEKEKEKAKAKANDKAGAPGKAKTSTKRMPPKDPSKPPRTSWSGLEDKGDPEGSED